MILPAELFRPPLAGFPAGMDALTRVLRYGAAQAERVRAVGTLAEVPCTGLDK